MGVFTVLDCLQSGKTTCLAINPETNTSKNPKLRSRQRFSVYCEFLEYKIILEDNVSKLGCYSFVTGYPSREK
jgi:hypothetical protein